MSRHAARRALGLCLLIFLAFSASAQAATTVSGTVNLPTFPTGGAPDWRTVSVRVMGTSISAAVDSSFNYSLADVPESEVKLLVEVTDRDPFTQESRVIAVDASSGPVTGADFSPVVHWTEINYPPVWGQAGYTGDYSAWQTQWLSASVGFMMFKTNTDPWRIELYRTLDGGANWSMIGQWVNDEDGFLNDGLSRPSLDLIFHFSSADKGVVLADVHCLPCGNCGTGFYATNDGGSTWSMTYLGKPGSSYACGVTRFATIDVDHVIAAGGTGCATQGYSSGTWDVIWESSDGGANWQIAWTSGENESLDLTGLGANPNGDALAFFTRFGSATRQWLKRDGDTDTWGTRETSALVVNSGYGPADVPFLGDTVWASTSGNEDLAKGLYRSDNAGSTWQLLKSDLNVAYHGWADTSRGFFISDGPYATYDGGATWLYQADGDGSCCHGNDIWVFGPTSAVWNEIDQVLTYADPDFASLEVVDGAQPPDAPAPAGRAGVAAGAFVLQNQGSLDVKVSKLALRAFGTGNDAIDITQVHLYLDANGNGLADPGEAQLGAGAFAYDNGMLFFDLDVTVHPMVPVKLAVTLDMAANLPPAGTYQIRLYPANLTATAGGNAVSAQAPAGYYLDGPTLVTGQTVFLDDFESGLGNWTADDISPYAPWTITDAGYMSPTHAVAAINRTRLDDNYGLANNLILSTPLDLSASGYYYLTFHTNYYFDPAAYGRIYASSDGGSTWTQLLAYGSSEGARSSGGGFVKVVADLNAFAGQNSVIIRFMADWTSAWAYGYDWTLDDVEVVKIPLPDYYPGLTEGFESGDLLANPWLTGGNANWYVTASKASSGAYSARAGDIGDDGTSWLQVPVRSSAGQMSFDYWTDSESGYDYLIFYIDGVEKGRWSGASTQWNTVTVDITAGIHVLKWLYDKDNSESDGEDTAWIDNIAVPGTPYVSGCGDGDADSDNDGVLDILEDANRNNTVDAGETDPCNKDSDGDGVQDGTEQGYTADMVTSATDLGVFQPDLDPATTTNPLVADTDGDTLPDGDEDANHNGRVDAGETDPLVADIVPPSASPAIPVLLGGQIPVPAAASLSCDVVRTLAGDATLSWGQVEGATGYTLERATSSDFADAVELVSQQDVTSYQDTGLASGCRYYRLAACNSTGCGAWSGTQTVCHGAPLVPFWTLIP